MPVIKKLIEYMVYINYTVITMFTLFAIRRYIKFNSAINQAIQTLKHDNIEFKTLSIKKYNKHKYTIIDPSNSDNVYAYKLYTTIKTVDLPLYVNPFNQSNLSVSIPLGGGEIISSEKRIDCPCGDGEDNDVRITPFEVNGESKCFNNVWVYFPQYSPKTFCIDNINDFENIMNDLGIPHRSYSYKGHNKLTKISYSLLPSFIHIATDKYTKAFIYGDASPTISECITNYMYRNRPPFYYIFMILSLPIDFMICRYFYEKSRE